MEVTLIEGGETESEESTGSKHDHSGTHVVGRSRSHTQASYAYCLEFVHRFSHVALCV